MAASPFISIPLKKTDEVDWIHPIQSWISTSYQENPESYVEECNHLHRIRQDMRGAGKDMTGRDLLYRYYGQMEMLELRFPIDETHVKVSFNWYDAFSKKPTLQHSLAYEKACTLFNLGACIASIAALQPRTTDPTSQGGAATASPASIAFNGFQSAAGVFSYINDNFLHAPTMDLNKDTVKVLSNLMLAQAQECLFERSEGKGNLLRAKLASWLAWSYGSVVDGINDGLTRGVFYKDWASVCQIKHKYFTAVTHNIRAVMCESERKFGEAVARFQVAERYASEASKLSIDFNRAYSHAACPYLPADAATSLIDLTQALLTLMVEKHATAVKDNDLLYHDQVPTAETLQPVDKSCAVRLIALNEMYPAAELARVVGQDIFYRLIPLAVHEQASVYSEEKAKILRHMTERCDQADAEMQAALAFMRLPSSLDKFKGDGSVVKVNTTLLEPKEDVRGLVGWVEKEEKGASVQELSKQLNSIRATAKEELESIGQTLDADATEYTSMKNLYAEALTQPQSDADTTALRESLRNYRTEIEKGMETDKSMEQRYDKHKNIVAIMALGPRSVELERMYAEASVANDDPNLRPGQETNLLEIEQDSQLRSLVSNVESVLTRLDKVKKERVETLGDLRTRVQQDDINHLLLLNRRQNMSGDQQKHVFMQELEKFRAHQQRIVQSISRQQMLVNECTEAFRVLVESGEGRRIIKGWDKAEKGLETLEKSLKAAGEAYKEAKEWYTKNIQSGVDMLEVLHLLKEDVTSYATRRREERLNMVRQIEAERSRTAALPDHMRLFKQVSPQTSAQAPLASSSEFSAQLRQFEERVARMDLNNNASMDPQAYGNAPYAQPYQQPKPVQQPGYGGSQQPMYGNTQQPMYTASPVAAQPMYNLPPNQYGTPVLQKPQYMAPAGVAMQSQGSYNTTQQQQPPTQQQPQYNIAGTYAAAYGVQPKHERSGSYPTPGTVPNPYHTPQHYQQAPQQQQPQQQRPPQQQAQQQQYNYGYEHNPSPPAPPPRQVYTMHQQFQSPVQQPQYGAPAYHQPAPSPTYPNNPGRNNPYTQQPQQQQQPPYNPLYLPPQQPLPPPPPRNNNGYY